MAANGGAYPADLSLITKKREGFHFPWYVSPFIKLVRGQWRSGICPLGSDGLSGTAG